MERSQKLSKKEMLNYIDTFIQNNLEVLKNPRYTDPKKYEELMKMTKLKKEQKSYFTEESPCQKTDIKIEIDIAEIKEEELCFEVKQESIEVKDEICETYMHESLIEPLNVQHIETPQIQSEMQDCNHFSFTTVPESSFEEIKKERNLKPIILRKSAPKTTTVGTNNLKKFGLKNSNIANSNISRNFIEERSVQSFTNNNENTIQKSSIETKNNKFVPIRVRNDLLKSMLQGPLLVLASNDIEASNLNLEMVNDSDKNSQLPFDIQYEDEDQPLNTPDLIMIKSVAVNTDNVTKASQYIDHKFTSVKKDNFIEYFKDVAWTTESTVKDDFANTSEINETASQSTTSKTRHKTPFFSFKKRRREEPVIIRLETLKQSNYTLDDIISGNSIIQNCSVSLVRLEDELLENTYKISSEVLLNSKKNFLFKKTFLHDLIEIPSEKQLTFITPENVNILIERINSGISSDNEIIFFLNTNDIVTSTYINDFVQFQNAVLEDKVKIIDQTVAEIYLRIRGVYQNFNTYQKPTLNIRYLGKDYQQLLMNISVLKNLNTK